MKKVFIISVLIFINGLAMAQPKIVFLINDVPVGEKGSLRKDDKLSVRIENRSNLRFEFSKIVFGVVRQGIYEQVSRRIKNTVIDSIMGSGTDFKQQPEVVIDFRKLNITDPKQLIVVIHEIKEKNRQGEVLPSRQFTLGKEYFFWFY